ncbi:hypothetical protein SAMN06264855_102276 [Halorubrum vacuolatum]|uniref:Uncharacterized protein n=1 Tax=Halorubrum vacuolatum TaxID=63740 RepID=A0A238VD45_HALVU|nr:hypothetical protein SAMN06264855_102276 [Halorubrum vacuolatum]
MSPNTPANHGVPVLALLGGCLAIGIFVGGVSDDVGTLVTWFWVGIALAGIYLLTTIANSLDRIQ